MNRGRVCLIVPLYKGKRDIKECGNYRGIKLMSHAIKLWERIIEARTRKEVTIAEQQFGFMPAEYHRCNLLSKDAVGKVD